jgi:hypothetical protein
MPRVTPEQIAALTNSVDEDTRCLLVAIGTAAALEAVIEAVTEIMDYGIEVLHEYHDAKEIAFALSFGLKGLREALVEQVESEDEHVQSHLTVLTTEIPDFVPDNF